MRLHKAPRKQKDDFLQGFCTYTRVAKKATEGGGRSIACAGQKTGQKEKGTDIQCGANRQRQYHVQKLKEESTYA